MKQNTSRTEPGSAVAPSHAAPASPLPEYRSDELLRETRQASIMHRGQRYTLRETRSGKLILYK